MELLFSFTHAGSSFTNFTEEDALAAGVPVQALVAASAGPANQIIDDIAGRARSRYLTNGVGQDSIYLAKADEAQRYLDAGSPVDASGYPLLAPEAEALGVPVADLAATVIAERDAWHTVAGKIEGVRVGGKSRVLAATTVAEVLTARDEAVAALNLL